MGRTKRKRRRKSNQNKGETVKTCFQRNLLLWAIGNGLNLHSLTPSNFPLTGRGLKTTRHTAHGDVIISLPKSLLITFDTIWDSDFKNIMTNKDRIQLMPNTAFTLFLISEKQKRHNSFYHDYINSVPCKYTTPASIPEIYSTFIPKFVLNQRNMQINQIKRQLTEIKKVILHHPKMFSDIELEEVLWAWNIINTRSVFFSHEDLKCKTQVNVKNIDFALAPVLDLLNHSDKANIKASYNSVNDMYEIRTFDVYKPGEQVFINYGPHSNRKLLYEYGFFVPNNIHSYIPISVQKLQKHFCPDLQIEKIDKYADAFKKLSLKTENIGFGVSGPDWTFLVVSHILSKETGYENISHYPEQCNGPCIIAERCRDIIFEFLTNHKLSLENLSAIDCDAVDIVKSLLVSEIQLLEAVNNFISEKCLL